MYLNVWPPVVGIIWEGLEDVALVEEACHLMWLWGLKKPTPFAVSFLSLSPTCGSDVGS